MKKYIILLLAVTIALSCKKSKDQEPQEECLLNCFIHQYQFNFRLVDKATGADLVFGANPRYSSSDVKLFYDAAGTYPVSTSPDINAKAFRTFMGKTVMYLKLGSTTYKLDATFRGVDCCTSIVESLKIDGMPVCAHCNDIIDIPVN